MGIFSTIFPRKIHFIELETESLGEPTVKTETWHGANVDISEVGLDKSLNMRKILQRKYGFRQFHQNQGQGTLQLSYLRTYQRGLP